MNSDTDLYTTHAQDFSDSRQAPWAGWEKVMSVVKKEGGHRGEGLKVMDLGCGNGRFLKYLLQDPAAKIQDYVGVDYSDILLNIAKKEADKIISDMNKKPAVSFFKLDLNAPGWSLGGWGKGEGRNLITAFGIIHHINSFQNRKNILQYSYNLLEPGGILVVAYWQFEGKARYRDKLSPRTASKTISKSDKYSIHDFIMKFGNSGATRFVHNCNLEEIAELEQSTDFKVIDSFYSDGKENNQNLYKIYQK